MEPFVMSVEKAAAAGESILKVCTSDAELLHPQHGVLLKNVPRPQITR